jgi:hypothetical protein
LSARVNYSYHSATSVITVAACNVRPVASSTKLAEAALAAVGGSRRILAQKLGVSRVHVGLVLTGERGFSAALMIRAARLTQRRPLDVLREYGEADLAEELEASVGQLVTPEQLAHLERWDQLPAAL